MARVAGSFRDRGLTGFDLAGPEEAFPDARVHARAFDIAREAGLGITIHAGEWGGADQVRRSLDAVSPSRIAHGARAADDASLMAELARRGVTLDVCPTSNVQASIFPSLSAFPLPALDQRGRPAHLVDRRPHRLRPDAGARVRARTLRHRRISGRPVAHEPSCPRCRFPARRRAPPRPTDGRIPRLRGLRPGASGELMSTILKVRSTRSFSGGNWQTSLELHAGERASAAQMSTVRGFLPILLITAALCQACVAPSPNPVPTHAVPPTVAPQPRESVVASTVVVSVPFNAATETPTLTASIGAQQFLEIQNRGGPAVAVVINGTTVATSSCHDRSFIWVGQNGAPALPWVLTLVRLRDGVTVYTWHITELPRYLI